MTEPRTALRTVAGGLFAPGLYPALRGSPRAGAAVAALFTVAALFAAARLPFTAGWRALLLDPEAPSTLLVVATLVSVALVVSVVASAVADRVRGAGRFLVAAAAVVSCTPVAAAAWVAVPAIEVLDRSFVDAPVAVPSPLPPTSPPPVPTTTPPTTATPPTTTTTTVATSSTEPPTTAAMSTVPTTAPPPPVTAAPDDGRVNVLLIGGDAGPGRWGLRADALNVVSVDPAGGPAVVVGVPRNLYGAQLPPGALRDRFPSGFPDLVNAVYPWGTSNAAAVRAALGPTDDPGASLTAAVVAEVTGLRIDGWVLVDMAGFIDVVDALGGVDVYVPKAVPAPGNVPSGKHPLPERFEVGWHRMDGTDALGYVRSRSADSDYQRMARQRCVLVSLAAQHGTGELLVRWPTLAGTFASTVRTNLSPAGLADLLDVAASGGAVPARTVALVPPVVPQRGWDPAAVRALVAATVDPPPTAPVSGIAPPPAPEPGCIPSR